MRVNIFSVLGMVGMLSGELAKAAEDGKITVAEGITILEAICDSLGIELDKTGVEVDA